jgi:hypothetical protein
MSAALPLPLYRDPVLVVADTESGNVLPEAPRPRPPPHERRRPGRAPGAGPPRSATSRHRRGEGVGGMPRTRGERDREVEARIINWARWP